MNTSDSDYKLIYAFSKYNVNAFVFFYISSEAYCIFKTSVSLHCLWYSCVYTLPHCCRHKNFTDRSNETKVRCRYETRRDKVATKSHNKVSRIWIQIRDRPSPAGAVARSVRYKWGPARFALPPTGACAFSLSHGMYNVKTLTLK